MNHLRGLWMKAAFVLALIAFHLLAALLFLAYTTVVLVLRLVRPFRKLFVRGATPPAQRTPVPAAVTTSGS